MDEELDDFSDEHICSTVAPVQGGVVHREVDSFSSNTNGLNAMEIAYVALAAKTKPNIEPYSKPGCISMLHRELSCPGFKMMWAKIKELCWDGDDDGKVFGDIGSGYGQVCMMAMLLTNCARSWGIEYQEGLHHAALIWKEEFCDKNAFRKRHFDEHLQFVEADISKLTPEAQQLISEADLIFCNNLLFGSMETKYKRCHGICRRLTSACTDIHSVASRFFILVFLGVILISGEMPPNHHIHRRVQVSRLGVSLPLKPLHAQWYLL